MKKAVRRRWLFPLVLERVALDREEDSIRQNARRFPANASSDIRLARPFDLGASSEEDRSATGAESEAPVAEALLLFVTVQTGLLHGLRPEWSLGGRSHEVERAERSRAQSDQRRRMHRSTLRTIV